MIFPGTWESDPLLIAWLPQRCARGTPFSGATEHQHPPVFQDQRFVVHARAGKRRRRLPCIQAWIEDLSRGHERPGVVRVVVAIVGSAAYHEHLSASKEDARMGATRHTH